MSVDSAEAFDPEDIEPFVLPETLAKWKWDDGIIVGAYNLAIEEKALEDARMKAAEEEAKKKEAAAIKEKFPVGSYCRALYSGDGCYYEGKVSLLKEYSCMVEFVGYNNSEEVELKNLKPSKGKKTRKNQIKVAKETYAMNFTYAAERQEANYVPPYECPTNAGAAENTQNMPATYYAARETPNLASLPAPPEPPMPPCSVMNNPSMSALLMSWYMAGYYTGFNQTQKGTSCSAKPCCHDHSC